MPLNPDSLSLEFAPVTADDFEALHAIRTAAMRPSLENLGRYDPVRSRQRLLDLFFPADTRFILHAGQRVGFYTLRAEADYLKLVHLYVLPAHQSTGIGAAVLQKLTTQADAAGQAIELCALRESPSNSFYQRHGFTAHSEDDWNINYRRGPAPACS